VNGDRLKIVYFADMAAKRLAASAVDWAAFAERVYPAQMESFRAFKAKSDGFIAKYVTCTKSPGSLLLDGCYSHDDRV